MNGVNQMIKAISVRLTDIFIRAAIFGEDDRQNYIYCFQVLIFDLISLLTVLSLAVIFGRILVTAVYLLIFTALRFNCGGFHASTHFRCFLILFTSYLIFLTLLALLPAEAYSLVCLVAAGASTLTVFILAPQQHVNRKFTAGEYKAFKRRSRVFALIFSAIFISGIVLLKPGTALYFLSGSLGMLTIAMSLIAAKIQDFLRRKEKC
jgi:accessory gene regulator B